jgi:hypothetical protein
MIKRFIQVLAGSAGYELCRLSRDDLEALPPQPRMNYKEAQVYRGLTASGQISLVEARFLMSLVARSDPTRPIVEVGTLYGHSTLVMCLAKQSAQKLYAVDNISWNSLGISPEVHRAATRRRLAECIDHYGVEVVPKGDAEFYASYDGPPPALYLCDADHSYEAVKADIAWARRVGASIICGDDYVPRAEGVTRAVNEAGGPRELHDGLWLL